VLEPSVYHLMVFSLKAWVVGSFSQLFLSLNFVVKFLSKLYLLPVSSLGRSRYGMCLVRDDHSLRFLILSFPDPSLVTLSAASFAALSITRCRGVRSVMIFSAAVGHVLIAPVMHVHANLCTVLRVFLVILCSALECQAIAP